MEEMSNKTIAVLVVCSIVVSALGMVIALSKFDSFPSITGFASSSGTGTTNVTISATTYITMTDDFIDLGSLEPNEVKNSEDATDYFTVQNDGSVNIDVALYDAASLFSGTDCSTTPNSCYKANGATAESGSVNTTYGVVPNGAPTKVTVITGLTPTDSVDSATIGVEVTVPPDEPAGDKTTSMTIVATAS